MRLPYEASLVKTVWLASYPKSGNTWARMLLANLRAVDAPVDINNLPLRGGMSSARAAFDFATFLDSGLLSHEEIDRLRPAALAHIASYDDDALLDARDGEAGDGNAIRYGKSHDAYTLNDRGTAVMGGAAAASAAVLIVRDPRDVAPSLAHHNGSDIDTAIAFMNDPAAAFCGHRDRQPNQLRQMLPGWSGFNASWLDQTDIPLHLLRYEDMRRDPPSALTGLLAFAGQSEDAETIARAARFADFEQLREQEQASGFREGPRGNFFRRGIAGGWRDELTAAQARSIEATHGAMMDRLGYAPDSV